MEDFSAALSMAGAAPFIAFLVGLVKMMLPEKFNDSARLNVLIVIVLSGIWAGVLWQSDLVDFQNLATGIVGVLTLATSATGLRSWISRDVLSSQVRQLTNVDKAT